MIRQTFPLHGIPRKFEILMPRKFLVLTVFEIYKVKRCQFVSGKNVLSTELAGQFVAVLLCTDMHILKKSRAFENVIVDIRFESTRVKYKYMQSLPGHRPWLLTAINRVSGQGRCPGRLCHGVSGQGRRPGRLCPTVLAARVGAQADS